ncbi:hypothetical protein GALMADRAFT_259790 [Galerina marginata CBS 339.88]|uniref:Uncharacterized protein n=1 Tax=Galerina marginata (strain CBS 339.88) TaxID=685588 RepID=A0A067S5I9_GALM3|nr:hypothetical protein GALMADRAFT_259790 [Galerina marginata CBS 339.88]
MLLHYWSGQIRADASCIPNTNNRTSGWFQHERERHHTAFLEDTSAGMWLRNGRVRVPTAQPASAGEKVELAVGVGWVVRHLRGG